MQSLLNKKMSLDATMPGHRMTSHTGVLSRQAGLGCCKAQAIGTAKFSKHLDAQQSGIDDEVAALIEDGIWLRCFRVCYQVLLASHATPKVNGLQVVQLRLASLQFIGCCYRLIIGSP